MRISRGRGAAQALRHAVSSPLPRPPAWPADAEPAWLGPERPRDGRLIRIKPLGSAHLPGATLAGMSTSVRSAIAGRGFLLLPAAALAVHELRYRLAYGSQADSALAAQGHGYLDSLAPWLVLLLGLAFGTFLVRAAGALAGRVDLTPRRSFAALWLLASTSLVATFVAQELLEGVFAAGHPAGLSGLVGHGGWWALAASIAVGAGVAAVLRLASEVVASVVRLVRSARQRTARAGVVRRRSIVLPLRGALASAAAGRAPPST